MFYSHEIASLLLLTSVLNSILLVLLLKFSETEGEGDQKDSHIVCISSKNCPELSFVYGAQVAIQKRVTLPK